MQVSELSTELGVPASAVLEACQRLGIDATWAGAELSAADASRLRGDSTLMDRPDLPPTAAGSIPGLVDGPPASPTDAGADVDASDPGGTRAFDRRAGSAMVFWLVALAAIVVAEQIANVFVVAAIWVVAVGVLVGCLVVGRRAWYRARVRPDRYWGSWLAPLAMVLALAGLVGLGAATYTAVRSAPADDAPLDLGKWSSVQRLRWGYQRTVLLQGNGWKQPVKVAGTCWNQSDRERDQDNRPAERIEVGNVSVACNTEHTIEVLDAYNISRDADAPYPGAEALVANGLTECADELSRAREVIESEGGGPISLLVEIPTEQGWDDADHSVACVAVTDVRSSALLSGG